MKLIRSKVVLGISITLAPCSSFTIWDYFSQILHTFYNLHFLLLTQHKNHVSKNFHTLATNVLHLRTPGINCLQIEAPKWSMNWACHLRHWFREKAFGSYWYKSSIESFFIFSCVILITIVRYDWFLEVLTLHFSFCA